VYRSLIGELNEIKTKLLDLTEALNSDEMADKDFAVDKLLNIIRYIDLSDVDVTYIRKMTPD
jgi:negative regulator of replication initiation